MGCNAQTLLRTNYKSENTRIIGVIDYVDITKNCILVFFKDHKGNTIIWIVNLLF
jgi:hypothetical protein